MVFDEQRQMEMARRSATVDSVDGRTDGVEDGRWRVMEDGVEQICSSARSRWRRMVSNRSARLLVRDSVGARGECSVVWFIPTKKICVWGGQSRARIPRGHRALGSSTALVRVLESRWKRRWRHARILLRRGRLVFSSYREEDGDGNFKLYLEGLRRSRALEALVGKSFSVVVDIARLRGGCCSLPDLIIFEDGVGGGDEVARMSFGEEGCLALA